MLSSLSLLEIDWVRVGERAFIAALYHPPRPTYKLESYLTTSRRLSQRLATTFRWPTSW